MSSVLRVSLVRVLEHYLTPQQFKRYVKNDRSNQLASPQHFYNAALRDLSIRDTESAIFHLIRVFDLEPRHIPSLHLARTMLFGLNKLFQESGGELYRSKFPNLNSYRARLDKQIQELELEDQRIRNEMTQLDSKKGFLGGIFGGNAKRAQRQAQLNQRAQAIQQELAQIGKRRAQTLKLVQIQEFANVISLILEVSMFPARYSWLSEEKGKEDPGQKLQTQIWYG
ncbi:MAG: hypothetical protein CVV27_07685 [Candidatus Melainabacteria bacterium HGW-Melainabacteria-1]|nr:MAG: hypothetical protein CVV27_07685 [Candidatus Melainabacteria bacterium HGW-Melainabacteria-1]